MSKQIKIFIAILLLSISFIACAILNISLIFNEKAQHTQTIIIPKHCSLKCITNVLYEHKSIQYHYHFLLSAYVTTNWLKKSLVAGEYLIEKGDTIHSILKKLSKGAVVIHKIKVPEGLTTQQIINLLRLTPGLIDTQNFEHNYKEDELFPSTYLYLNGMEIKNILDKMKSDMSLVLNAEWKARNKEIDKIIKTPYQALILASIIEKEARYKDELQTIASVYLNRLQKNMRLQADPTIVYAISSWDGFKRKLTYNDLKTVPQYNTYPNQGLPPTPICNPGKDSISAVLKPIKTNYLYFVATKNGKHLFAENYKTHLANIKKKKKELR